MAKAQNWTRFIVPATLAALGEIGGVGTRKLEAFGDAFLAVIRQH